MTQELLSLFLYLSIKLTAQITLSVSFALIYTSQDAKSSNGYHLVGDVCYEEAIRKASAITPVPGGIGPITISMLLSNTLDSAKRFYNIC